MLFLNAGQMILVCSKSCHNLKVTSRSITIHQINIFPLQEVNIRHYTFSNGEIVDQFFLNIS